MISGWGNYPKIQAVVKRFRSIAELKTQVLEEGQLLPQGNRRSYGDSALSETVSDATTYRYFLDFEPETGLLHVQSGVLLADIIEHFVPKGWFLKVSPGTKLVTVGGAIASDVHGKNHHIDGCFSACVDSFRLMLPDGSIETCSPSENTELFNATCGGMGLTGVILDAKIQLKPIRSKYIQQTTIKTANLQDTFAAFEQYADSPYSVAWIDCLAKGSQLGRSLLMVGDFADDGDLSYQAKSKISVPGFFPSFCLNRLSVKIFNALYYNKVTKRESRQRVDIDNFFYPLDALDHWNRIYGKEGFVQYQFILPKEQSLKGLEEILNRIAGAGMGSFLAVLKLYGKENDNDLSFPMEGYSLALDFKMQTGLLPFLDELDQIVLKYDGRLYLAKDARMKQAVFEQGYPRVERFRALRKKYKMSEKFNSLQSRRLGL